ncbi:MAG: hypothetical protein LBK26_03065 [Rickettsiales bacterium]|jgi:hypothetical protein|nr:hypothetical protein [Rickettsiales bacterium]
MSEILGLIFNEIDSLEESAAKLRSSIGAAGKQTDLEVAILTQQVADLRTKNENAAKYIGETKRILENLKKE